MSRPVTIHPSQLGPKALAHLAVKKPRAKPRQQEHEAQTILFQELIPQHLDRYPELADAYAIPNYNQGSGKSGQRWGRYFKQEGRKAGMPDIVLPHARGPWHHLYLELKVGSTAVSATQHAMIDRLRACDSCATIVRRNTPQATAREALDAMICYLTEGKEP